MESETFDAEENPSVWVTADEVSKIKKIHFKLPKSKDAKSYNPMGNWNASESYLNTATRIDTFSITSDWVAGASINYGKAGFADMARHVSGLMSGAGAQGGLISHTKKLINSRKVIKGNVKSGNYFARGGSGAMNLMKYHVGNARNIVKNLGLNNLKMSLFSLPQLMKFGILSSFLINR